jgi:hypothetical protein
VTDQAKRTTATWLIIAAVALAMVAGVLWQRANTQAEEDNRVAELTAILSEETFYEPVEPNHAPSIVVGVVAGVSFLGGIILLAGSRPED